MTTMRKRYGFMVLWLTLFWFGCAAPGGMPPSAPASETSGASTVPLESPLTVAARSFHSDFDNVAQEFINNTPTDQGWNIASGESATLVFQVGHAGPDALQSGPALWSIVPESTRYLVQAMCQTMAHGPETNCQDSTVSKQYGCPGDWDVSQTADTVAHRSVYDRWGLNYLLDHPDTRLICGDSTLYTPQHDSGTMIWDYSAMAEYRPVDAIMGALSEQAVSLCLTLGGHEADDSALWLDQEFVTTPNEHVGDYYHILYSKPFIRTQDDDPTIYAITDVHNDDPDAQERSAEMLALMQIDEMARDAQENAEEQVAELLAQQEPRHFPRCLPTVKVDGANPALSKQIGEQQSTDLYFDKSETDYFAQQPYVPGGQAALEQSMIANAVEQGALNLLGQPGEFTQDFVFGRHLLLAIIPVDPNQRAGDIRVTHRNSLVTFRRQIDLATLPELSDSDAARVGIVKDLLIQDEHAPLIYVIGPGGRVTVQMNQDVSVINTFAIARNLLALDAWTEMKTPGEAFVEALARIEGTSTVAEDFGQIDDGTAESKPYYNPFVLDAADGIAHPDRRYTLEFWRWGYYEASARNLDQGGMEIWYEFQFTPKAGNDPITPVLIPVQGTTTNACTL